MTDAEEMAKRLERVNADYDLARGIHADIRSASSLIRSQAAEVQALRERVRVLTEERDEALSELDWAKRGENAITKAYNTELTRAGAAEARIRVLEAALEEIANCEATEPWRVTAKWRKDRARDAIGGPNG